MFYMSFVYFHLCNVHETSMYAIPPREKYIFFPKKIMAEKGDCA